MEGPEEKVTVTVRRTSPVPRSLEGIAGMVPAWLVEDFETIESLEEFRMWWAALAEAVEIATGVSDHGLVMSVAVKLGVSPADWFRL